MSYLFRITAEFDSGHAANSIRFRSLVSILCQLQGLKWYLNHPQLVEYVLKHSNAIKNWDSQKSSIMLTMTGRARLFHHEILSDMPNILTHMTSYLGLECMPALRRLLLGFSKLTGVLKCSGLVRGSLSSVSLSIKCLSPFRHICVRFSVAMSPSSNTFRTETEIYYKSIKSMQFRCKTLLGYLTNKSTFGQLH